VSGMVEDTTRTAAVADGRALVSGVVASGVFTGSLGKDVDSIACVPDVSSSVSGDLGSVMFAGSTAEVESDGEPV
jgi:hypothetical protein